MLNNSERFIIAHKTAKQIRSLALRVDFLPPPQREIPWLHKFTVALDLHV